jgi:hypothetical protein
VIPGGVLHPGAIDANRRGELSEEQRRNLDAWASAKRRGQLNFAVWMIVMAILIGLFASPRASIVKRASTAAVCLTIAAALIVRSVLGSDALTRDVRRGQVLSAEGAIGKRRIGYARSNASYFLEIGSQRFKAASSTYTAAPDAGLVRVFYIPDSRRVVNLERLPDAPLPESGLGPGILQSLGVSLLSPTREERNEAHAGMAAMHDAIAASVSRPPASPSSARDPRPLGESLVGTWSNPMMRVTFAANGAVTTSMFGRRMDGQWSVDGPGRLRADIAGRQGTAEAWIVGEQLTINLDGTALTFARVGDQ